MDGVSANQSYGIYKNSFPIEEDLLIPIVLIYDIDILDGNVIGKNAQP